MIIKTINETEHASLIYQLVKMNIDYEEKFFTNSTFPSLNTVFGELSINDIYSDEIKSILDNLQEDQINEGINDVLLVEKKGRDYIKIGLVIYSCIATLLFFKYWNISLQYDSNKNYTVNWNIDNTAMTYHNRKTGEIESVFYDKNYDMNFEEIRSFQFGKGPVMISYDRNEDGFYEDISHFSFNSIRVGNSEDSDNDRYRETEVFILESGDTVRFVDSNKNGIFEEKKK